jgi:hypothetical protein
VYPSRDLQTKYSNSNCIVSTQKFAAYKQADYVMAEFYVSPAGLIMQSISVQYIVNSVL